MKKREESLKTEFQKDNGKDLHQREVQNVPGTSMIKIMVNKGLLRDQDQINGKARPKNDYNQSEENIPIFNINYNS